MGLGLGAIDKIGKLESIERQMNALLVLVALWDLPTTAVIKNIASFFF